MFKGNLTWEKAINRSCNQHALSGNESDGGHWQDTKRSSGHSTDSKRSADEGRNREGSFGAATKEVGQTSGKGT